MGLSCRRGNEAAGRRLTQPRHRLCVTAFETMSLGESPPSLCPVGSEGSPRRRKSLRKSVPHGHSLKGRPCPKGEVALAIRASRRQAPASWRSKCGGLRQRSLHTLGRRGDLAHNSVYRAEVQSGGMLANFSTVLGPFFDRLAEVESNEDARIRIFGRRLGEARIRAEHR
jgi:hypothetical protein